MTPPPRTPQALGCVLYACFILSRLCVPVFANMSREPFSTRALVLSIMHATLPGITTEDRAREGCARGGRLPSRGLPSSPPSCGPSHHCSLQMTAPLSLSTLASSSVSSPLQSFLSRLPLKLLPK